MHPVLPAHSLSIIGIVIRLIKERLNGWLTVAINRDASQVRSEIESALASRSGLAPQVVDAVLKVPRKEFVTAANRSRAQEDRALAIGSGQTISQPSLVALMISELGTLDKSDRVLDVGCGSGYQAAVLSLLVGEVVSVERIPELAKAAKSRLARLGYQNVKVVDASDDHLGCPEAGPYDAIIVGAGVPGVPDSLLAQLKIGGRMVIPVGEIRRQRVVTVLKSASGTERFNGVDCVFVPLIGPEAW